MERLFSIMTRRIEATDTTFVRDMMNQIEWDARLVGIKGSRGIGKTTLLLQRIKLYHQLDGTVLYVSADNIWFGNHTLYNLATDFVQHGGKYLYVDEVHKYPNWSQEMKNIYDDLPELHVTFTGSSLLQILNASADLSRRAIIYEMQGFSFREYLNLNQKQQFPSFVLDELLSKHSEIERMIVSQLKPLQFFHDYLRTGYYPFYNELPGLYDYRLNEVMNFIIEFEIPQLRGVGVAYVPKVKQLLGIIAASAPFIPNITKLSERIGISRNLLLAYLKALHDSRLIFSAHKQSEGISILQKPDKIYLENTNLMYAIADVNTDIGNVRETFAINQLRYHYEVNLSPQSDFLVNKKYTFEIGGQHKGKSQITNLPDSYIFSDDIEYGYNQKLPLWLLGFLY